MEKENEYLNEDEQKGGCFTSTLGCVFQIILGIIFMIVMFVGNSMVRSCTRQQMKKSRTEYYSANERLQKGVEEVKASLPHQIDDVTKCTDIELTPEAYIYVYTIDESVDFDNTDFAIFDKEVKQEIRANKEKLALVAQLCKETGRKVCYRYVSAKNGKTHTIKFNATELI